MKEYREKKFCYIILVKKIYLEGNPGSVPAPDVGLTEIGSNETQFSECPH